MTKRGRIELSVLMIGFFSFACSSSNNSAPQDGFFLAADAGIPGTTVTGFTWDPEAFWFGLATCAPPGQMCPIPPITTPGIPLLENALVGGAAVGLFDPFQPMQTMPLPYNAPGLTKLSTGSGYSIPGVPIRQFPPYFAIAVVPGNPMLPGGDMGPPVPSGHYLPTFTLKPISNYTTTWCLLQKAALISDKGILEAVAKYLTSTGTATIIPDFLNPAKFGGVAIWWNYAAGPPVLRVPAFGSFMTADQGTTYSINWLPPGQGPPPIVAIQSTRGFYVNTMGPSAPGAAIAVSVTLLPPLKGPPPNVTFVAKDPVLDPKNGRPFEFPSLRPIQLAPGLISFGEMPAIQPGDQPPPDFVCLPPS